MALTKKNRKELGSKRSTSEWISLAVVVDDLIRSARDYGVFDFLISLFTN